MAQLDSIYEEEKNYRSKISLGCPRQNLCIFTFFNEPSVGGTDQLQIFTHKKAYYTMHYGFESSELRWMSTVLVQKGQHLLPQCRTKQDLDR